MSQVELIIMQYAFKFDFNSRCQWGVAGALGAPDRKCRKPYIVGCFSNWKFIGSSKLLIENEPNEVPPPPCAATSLWINLFNLSNCLLSDLSVIEIIQERSTLHKRQCQQYRAIVSVSFPPLSISPSAPSVSFYIAISLVLPLSLSCDQRELSSSVYRAGGYTSNG